ncbi:MAG: DUF547 domain-containing protein [Candidatus Omnitrophica bacterium]|nr:DUF547 domain-containing protein [Candidatus Omnitrophota bacterium]
MPHRRVCAVALAMVIAGGLAPAASSASAVDHSMWDQLLKRHVRQGLVDYTSVQAERKLMDQYLEQLAIVDVDTLPSKEAKLAFWVNAYNASVVKGVLDHAPVTSVKEVKGFFDRIRYRVAGRERTLNEIEGEGRALGDWRIHFAVVCASSSCPPLINEAYAGPLSPADAGKTVATHRTLPGSRHRSGHQIATTGHRISGLRLVAQCPTQVNGWNPGGRRAFPRHFFGERRHRLTRSRAKTSTATGGRGNRLGM